MATSRLVCATDLSGDAPVIAGGTMVVGEYERLREFLEARAPAVAGLFAEPVFGAKTPTGFRNASWYAAASGDVLPFSGLSTAQQNALGQQLSDSFALLRPLFADPLAGEVLRHAVLVPSLDALHIVGSTLVLVKWGFVPATLPQGPRALEDHFAATFGRYIPWSPFTPPNDAQAGDPLVAPLGAVGGRGLPLDKAPAAPVTGTPEQVGGPADPSPSSPPPPPPPPVVAVVAAPWWRRPGLRSGLIALAFLLLLLLALLLFLFWGGRWNEGGLAGASGGLGPDDQRAIHSALLDALRAERDRLAALAAGDVCTLDPQSLPRGALSLPARPVTPMAPTSPAPAPGTVAPAPSTTPPSPVPSPSASLPAPGRASGVPLNASLESSTVLVLTPSGMGSGFFVTPNRVVTNRHVVEDGRGAVETQVKITSKALGHLYDATVESVSRASEIGGQDYAVLAVATPPPAALSLPLVRQVEKLTTVIAAGYPGYLVRTDPAMERLMAGDVSAAPEMVLSEGKVQVVHDSGTGIPIVIHSADISQGNSGGPLVDDCGRVAGINTFIGQDENSGRRALYSLGAADLAGFLLSHNVPIAVEDTPCPLAPR